MPDLSGFVRIGGQVRRLNNYDGGWLLTSSQLSRLFFGGGNFLKIVATELPAAALTI
jgi:hypothetical protein